MFKNYFVVAWRNLLRNKTYSIINIAGLSVGLACCMLIILYNNDEVSFDRFHRNAENIYRITADVVGEGGKVTGQNAVTGMMPGPVFKEAIPEIAAYVRINGGGMPAKVGDEVFDQEVLYVDDNFFDVFTFPLTEGNKKGVLSDIHNVVLSESMAKKFFGTAHALGKTIELASGDNGAFEQFMVTGIVPESPQNSSIRLSVVLPLKLSSRNNNDQQWMNFYLNTFVLLHPDADPKKTEAKFEKIYKDAAAAQVKEAREQWGLTDDFRYKLQPLTNIHLSTELGSMNGLSGGSNPIYSKILGGIALFMLVIACINFVNLTVARSLKRAKEIGVRKVIGGERKQLVVQFLGESFILSCFAFVLALGLVLLALPFFNTLAGKALSFSYLVNTRMVLGYVLLFVVTGLLAGFYPALVLSGYNPVHTLYNRMPMSGKNYLSKGLLVLQFTLTTFLIIATITVRAQFNFLTGFDLGYNDKNLVIVNTNSLKAHQLKSFRDELQKHPGVQSVAVHQPGSWGTVAKVNGEQIDFSLDIVDSAYFSSLEIPIVAGRNFSSTYPSDSVKSVLVNEAFMKKAGWKDLNNREVDFFYDSIKYNVIGVVKNYHYASLMEEIKPQLFTMNPKYNYGQFLVKLNPKNTSASLQHIEKVFKTKMPFVPYQYNFKDALNTKQYEEEAKWKQIILAGTLLTIFISCIGLFGLAVLAAQKRTKEIGIRKVLGASVTNIAAKLSGSFITLVLAAAVIAFPIAWWALNKWLQNYPYRVSIDGWVFIIALLTVAVITLATVSFQAVKAALANPVKSLRTE